MDDKITAVYLMARQSELQPEDQGSYDRPLKQQEEECLQFIREKSGGEPSEPVEVYKSRSQLLIDLERGRLRRLVVLELNRLGSSKEDIEGILFEFNMQGVEVLCVHPE